MTLKIFIAMTNIDGLKEKRLTLAHCFGDLIPWPLGSLMLGHGKAEHCVYMVGKSSSPHGGQETERQTGWNHGKIHNPH